MTRKLLAALGVVVALGATHACGSDNTVAPSRQSATASGGLRRTDESDNIVNPPVDTVVALKRSAYLSTDISESAIVGPEGGQIGIAASGGTIIFPAGALRDPTLITMTAKAGWNIAYELEPHGTTFDRPVILLQDLAYTLARQPNKAQTVQVGYYRGSLDSIFLDFAMSLARVSELRGVELDRPLNPRVARFYIYHFSGWLMSSGFKEEESPDSLP